MAQHNYNFRLVYPDEKIIDTDFYDCYSYPQLYNHFRIDGKRIDFARSRNKYEVICSFKPDEFVIERRIGYFKEWLTYRGDDYYSALVNFRDMCYSLLDSVDRYIVSGVIEDERQDFSDVQSPEQSLF